MLPLHYSGEEEVKLGGIEDEEAGRRGQGDRNGRDGVCNTATGSVEDEWRGDEGGA